jgi:hypothetical protein
VSDTDQWLLEIRLFTLRPGARDEFHRISRDETIPLMRECGITVLTHGPSLCDEDGYFLLRAFRSEQERVELSQSVYATREWEDKYEKQVMAMIADYHTSVLPTSQRVIEDFAVA